MINKNIGRIATVGYYMFQQTRQGFMNQIRDVIRKLNEDIPFDKTEDKKETKTFSAQYSDGNLLKLLNDLHEKNKLDKSTYIFLVDCLETVMGRTLNKETGKTEPIKIQLDCPHCQIESEMDDTFKGVAGIEEQYKKLMAKAIKQEPIYLEFLSKIRGLGPIHSANLLKAFGDCSKYDTISKLWAHAGYAVVDNRAPRRTKGSTVNYSPELRTMVWKISDNLMKQNKGIYRKTYDLHKSKQLARTYEPGELAKQFNGYKEDDTQLSKGHAHNRALRKMVKLFLSHFWEASRELAGLSCERTYVEGVLEHTHIMHWEEALELEGCLVDS